MSSEKKKPMLGIIGGMGPITSAEFVRMIYRCQGAVVEQDMVPCVLYSDPNVFDRTNAIVKGGEAATKLVEQVTNAIKRVDGLGVDKIVIACMTSHAYLEQIPQQYAEKYCHWCLLHLTP